MIIIRRVNEAENAFDDIYAFHCGKMEWQAAKETFEARDDEPSECVVDLYDSDGMQDAFCISTQMLEPLKAALRSPSKETTK